MLDAFDRLGTFYTAEKTLAKKSKISPSIQIDYSGIKGQIAAELARESQTKHLRVLPPQLTPQTLATFLGEAGCCWVLDDFHKIDAKEKRKMAQVMKLFMDMADSYNALKIIAIGAVDTARQVVEYDPEMRNRVSEIYVPIMTEDEIKEIPDKGEQLLNFELQLSVKNHIITFSDGLASVCHQLCLNICFAAGIRETLQQKIEIPEDAFERALEQYVEESSDTLKAAFDKAFRQTPEQRFNDGELIIRALVKCAPEGASKEELLSRVRDRQPEYKAVSLTIFLKKLQTSERGELIRFDQASGRYSFSENIYRAYASTFFERRRQKEKRPKKIEIRIDSNALLQEINRLLRKSGQS
jgi:hypothetical protein